MTTTDQKTVRENASAWIAKFDANDPSADDLIALKAWMDEDPCHAAEIKKMAKMWGQLNILTELAVPNSHSETILETNRLSYGAGWRWLPAGGLAAAVIVILCFLLFPSMQFDSWGKESIITGVGEQRRVVLDDGSSLLLNTNSHADIDYDDTARRIYLRQGQAYFDVSKDPNRPFLVEAGKGVVKAIGTAFSVYVTDRKLDVTVTEGTVELKVGVVESEEATGQAGFASSELAIPVSASGLQSGNSQSNKVALISAGQKARADQTVIAFVEKVNTSQLAREQSWREGVLRFSGESLKNVIAEVSRYTVQTITIEEKSLQELRFGGSFNIGETDKLLAALESSFGVRVDRVSNTHIRLSIKK